MNTLASSEAGTNKPSKPKVEIFKLGYEYFKYTSSSTGEYESISLVGLLEHDRHLRGEGLNEVVHI